MSDSDLVNYNLNQKVFNWQSLTVSNLLSADGASQLKEQAFEIIEADDRDVAVSLSNNLEALIGKASPANIEESASLDVVIFWFLKLRLFAFRNLSLSEQLEFLKKYTVLTLSDGLDLQNVIFKYIDIFASGQTILPLTKQFANSMVSSKALLGEPKAFTNNFIPTLANWLSEYQASLNRRKNNSTPAVFDILTFIDTNANVKLLTEFQKEVLRALLNLYNFLLSPVVFVDESKQKKVVSKNISGQSNPSSTAFSKGSLSKENFSNPFKTSIFIDDDNKTSPISQKSFYQDSLKPSKVANPIRTQLQTINEDGVNVQDVLFQKKSQQNRGLAMEPGTKQAIAENAFSGSVLKPSPTAPQKSEAKSSVPEQVLRVDKNIDTKLQALKQKVKSSKQN